MNKGVKLRLDAHNVLYDIYKYNNNLETSLKKININKFNTEDVSFIRNVTLNSMRYAFHNNEIIRMYIKKKPKIHEKILLISAITQLVFLNFKNYAVINSSVEIAKKFNIYHGHINASLKNIYNSKNELKFTKIKYSLLPKWFTDRTNNLSATEKSNFLKNFYLEPDLHLVFKSKRYKEIFEEPLYDTSNLSGFLKKRKKIKDIPYYNNGYWWIQDLSSSLALLNIPDKLIKNKNIDLCASPGGKSFQIMSKNKKIIMNDKNKKRLELLKENLNRLNYKTKIINYDVLKLDDSEKFDFIILDAPCSSVGTIRKNPEIFFKSEAPNFKFLIEIQRRMLEKASNLVNKNGIILYMVCSFIKDETEDQISNFLKNYNSFNHEKFYLHKENHLYKKFIKKNFMYTLPTIVNGFKTDGYFAAYLKKVV